MKKTVFLLAFLPLFASAAGIEVTPSRLELVEKTSASFLVANPTSDVQIFEVYADNFAELIKIQPASFTLESRSQQSVQITIDNTRPGAFATDISVVARPLADSRFSANTGVKIPISITVSGSKQNNSRKLFLILAALGISSLFYYVFRKSVTLPRSAAGGPSAPQ